jgi:hypothetical protein
MKIRLLLIVSLLLTTSSVLAQNREESKRFFRAGERAFNAGQYEMAADAFEQSYKLLPLAPIAFSTAQAHRLQYFVDKEPARLKRAVDLYRKYLAEVGQGGRRADAATSLAELEPILARIEAQGTVTAVAQKTVTRLLVSSSVVDASVSVDGAEAKAVPLALQVTAGSHSIKVTAKGYFPYEGKAEVFEGQFRVVEVDLKPMPALVNLRAESGAQVSVDGRLVATTPLARPLELTAGSHLITVLRRGRKAWAKEVTVERGQQMELSADLATSGRRKASLWVLGASGVAFLGATGFAVGAAVANSDADELLQKSRNEGALTPAEVAAYDEARADRNERRTAALVFGGVGLAVAAAGVVLFFMDTPTAEDSGTMQFGNTTVTPTVTGDGAGVSLVGRF